MKRFRNFTIITILTLWLSACSSAATPEPVTLRVARSVWPGYYPLIVAQSKGLYDKYNLHVEDKTYSDIGTVIKDLQAHKLDMGLAPISDALTLDSRNPGEFKVVMAVDYSNGSDAVIARAEVNSVADLKGKRIGFNIGTFGELLVRQMLETNGMTINDVTVVNTNASEVPKAIPDQIDAGQTFEPYITQGAAKGTKVIFSSADTPGLIADVAIIRKDYLEQHPEAVRSFIKGWFEAQAYWQAHTEESKEIVAKSTGLKASDITVDGVKWLDLAGNKEAFTVSTSTTSLYGSGQINIDFLVAASVVNKVPDIKQVLDPSFLPEK